MSSSYKAVCSDFYVNLKLNLKLELPRGRETVLSMFERVRRQYPGMTDFKRYKDELALESPSGSSPHRWIAVRSSSVRAGVVNVDELEEAYALHRAILEVAPYFLSISPLDVDFVEVLYGFDLTAGGNHDAIVAEALLGGSTLARLFDVPGGGPIDCQPVFGVSLGRGSGVEAYFEVKTRPGASRERERGEEPISVYLTLRKHGPIHELGELVRTFDDLAVRGEELVEARVLPGLVVPIRDAIVP